MISSSRHISEYFLAIIKKKNTFVARPLNFRFLLQDCDVIKFDFSLFKSIVFILGSYCGIKLKQNKHQCVSATKTYPKTTCFCIMSSGIPRHLVTKLEISLLSLKTNRQRIPLSNAKLKVNYVNAQFNLVNT